MKKLFYLTCFFSCTLILFISCENESFILQSSLVTQNKHQKLITSKFIEQQLQLKNNTITIDWNNPKLLEQDKKSEKGIYEYSLNFAETINNNSKLFSQNQTFKLIINELETKPFLELVKFQPYKNSLNTNPTTLNLNQFSGMKYVFNHNCKLTDIYVYENGELIDSFNKRRYKKRSIKNNSITKSADDAAYEDCKDLNGKDIPGCTPSSDNNDSSGSSGGGGSGNWVQVTTKHITHWYWVFTNGTTGEVINVNYSRTTTRTTTNWVFVRGTYTTTNYSYSYGNQETNQPLTTEAIEHIEDDKIDFDSTFEDLPCQKGIVEKSYENKSDLANSIKQVFDSFNSGNINLTFGVKDLAATGQLGSTDPKPELISSPVIEDPNLKQWNINVYFDTDFLNQGTDLAIAATSIHEQLHALLVHANHTGVLQATAALNPNNPTYAELIQAFAKHQETEDREALGRSQHKFMTNMVNEMTDDLFAFTQLRGIDVDRDYCKKIMWGKLHETETFKNKFPKFESSGGDYNPEYLEINQASNAEAKNEDKEYEHDNGTTYTASPKGTKCN